MDIMHLTTLNDPDLFIKLFTGKIDVYEPDDRSTWDWAVFHGNNRLWNAHGETVPMSVPFIPLSFGRAPRNPATKINSGYKAWEYQIYLYGLGPVLFCHILPRKYWLNFCKLVSGIRLLQRHTITHDELLKGHSKLMEFVHDVHLLTHIAPETVRAGPLSCYAQWTLETAIGNLGREIQQDRDLYANLTQRAILRAQVNLVHARFPSVKIDIRGSSNPSLPKNALEFEDNPGYAFLPRREEQPTPLNDNEAEALRIYWLEQGWPNLDSWSGSVCRWAKLQLPNGQRARCVWYEDGSAVTLRRTSCVEIICNGEMHIVDVQFYFCMRFGNVQYPLAIGRLFSQPDAEILHASSDTVHLCDPLLGREGLCVLHVSTIRSVVCMFPELEVSELGQITDTGKFALMQHPHLKMAQFSDEEADDENGSLLHTD
ncbi:hypothetical protein EDB86DRAFT_3090340 [Lactarius hatsudake]|nr:hypothetical protein EDB86DRAFT_3090340 [Lactarius hatsudake]